MRNLYKCEKCLDKHKVYCYIDGGIYYFIRKTHQKIFTMIKSNCTKYELDRENTSNPQSGIKRIRNNKKGD